MLLNGSASGLWKSVVTDLALHPHHESFGWIDGLLVGVALLALMALDYLLGSALRWVARRAGQIGEYRKANGLPPKNGDNLPPSD